METKMLLQFSSDITCNAEERTITGKIVPFGDSEVGHTNVGKVVFEAGSIEIPTNPKPKLLLEHDPKKPIGRLVSFTEDESGIYATFKVANTQRGTDSLIEASEQLRSGLSVGVEVIAGKKDKDRYRVKSSLLKEVSLVQAAAFKSAEVLSVAASEEEVVETPPTNESEAVVENTPDTATVEPKVEAPAVEAARPTVAAPIYAKPRINVTPATYLENTVKASLGNEDARQWIAAASDTDTTDVAGLVPTRQLTEIINGKTTSVRPTIDAVSSGVLPDAGMTFQIPRVKTAPTVAETAEKAAFSDTQVEIEYKTLTVKKYAGMQKFDVEVLDRTSPAFYAELISLMGDAYAKATDSAMVAALQADGVLDTTATTLPWDGSELASFIARAAKNIYEQTFRFPTAVIVSPTQWSNMIGLVDSSNRPILTATQPQNAAGSVSAQSIRGSILGIDLYVDPYLSGEADKSIIVVNRETYRWFESPTLQIRSNIVGTGQVEVGLYGYGCAATLQDYGAFLFNKA